MPQGVIHQHQRQHRLSDRRGADADAGVVAPVRVDHHRLAGLVDRAPVEPDARRGLDRDIDHDVLPGGNAAQNATRVVGGKTFRRHFVAVLGALLLDRAKPRADLHALDRVDAHHRVGDVRIQLVVDRFAPAHRHALRHRGNARAAGIAGLAQPVHERLQFGHAVRVRRKKRVGPNRIPALERDTVRAELRHVAADLDAMALAQPFFRNRARRHPHCGFARGLSPAAAMIADAVLLPVGVVGVAGTESFGNVAVVLAALVLVADQQRDRRAGRFALEHAGENFHRIWLAPLGDMPRGARAAAVEFMLDVGLCERESRRAAVHHATDRGPVALAERSNAEQPAE